MESHALELLRFLVWILGGTGTLIVVLLGGIFALAKWGGVRLLARLDMQDVRMAEFQQTVTDVGDEIKTLLTSETKLLRENQYLLSERVGKLETFRDFVQENLKYGRRYDDQNHNGT